MTIIIPAPCHAHAAVEAFAKRLPEDSWAWCDPAFADAYAARCAAFGVATRVLTTPPAARTVVVRSPHERSAA